METLSGIVILNKEEGMTSQSAVTRVRRLFGAAKAGHSGTLDPMATGVLPVLLGRATVAAEFLLTGDKHYLATLRLGLCTDTEDVTGAVTARYAGALPTEEEVLAVAAGFRGTSEQIPPMYSALKRDGRKLCDLAREGKTVEREPRTITVHSLDIERISDTDYRMEVVCSKGTYIRTLCADIGARLGTGAVMAALTRCEAAGFPLSAAHTLTELSEMSDAERAGALIPTETLFVDLPEVDLPPFFARLGRAGAEIYQRKIGTALPLGARVRLRDADGFFALGEVREFETGLAIKPIKMFA